MTIENEVEEEVEILDVLDFPQLYTRPALSTLLATLDVLAIPPPSWDLDLTPSQSSQPKKTKILVRGNPTTWLTSIISSSLKWLPSDESRELIWETASIRMSERCGRTAMPALTREFRLSEGVTIQIHEPTLDGDNLGLKTWGSAYALAKRVSMLDTKRVINNALGSSDRLYDRKILELGAGTGLAGLSVATTAVDAPVSVHLTDLPEIVPNLKRNVDLNSDIIPDDINITASVLDWRTNASAPTEADKYPLIIAADPLYSTEHPEWLSTVVAGWLENSTKARFIVELPLRKLYGGEVTEFRKLMEEKGMTIFEEGEESGRDDWGGGVEGEVMRCWWAVYGRNGSAVST